MTSHHFRPCVSSNTTDVCIMQHIYTTNPYHLSLVIMEFHCQPHGLHFSEMFRNKNKKLPAANGIIAFFAEIAEFRSISRDALAGFTWLICRALDCTRSFRCSTSLVFIRWESMLGYNCVWLDLDGCDIGYKEICCIFVWFAYLSY